MIRNCMEQKYVKRNGYGNFSYSTWLYDLHKLISLAKLDPTSDNRQLPLKCEMVNTFFQRRLEAEWMKLRK